MPGYARGLCRWRVRRAQKFRNVMQILCRRRASLAIAAAPCYRGLISSRFDRNPLVRQMMRRLTTMMFWLLGLLLVLVNFNLNDPYLIMMRGWGRMLLLAAGFTGLGLLLWRQSWGPPRGPGRLLVVPWCL